MNDTLKVAGRIGAELGAAKAENERLIEVLEVARSHIVEVCTVMNIPLPAATIRRIDVALSQQAEPATMAVACGGCGNSDESKRCLGCWHQFTATVEPAPAQAEQQPVTVPEGWSVQRTPDGGYCLTNDESAERAFFSHGGHRIARLTSDFLEALLSAAPIAQTEQPEQSGHGRDTARLDYMINERCLVDELEGSFFLSWPDLKEEQILSFETPREAIDHAMSTQGSSKP